MGQPGGRLAQLRAGTPANYLTTSPLQYLVYTYDAAGNVTTIADYNTGGTQTQSFGYDALDRLVSASATGGTGGSYSESYSYQANGRLASGPLGASYSYDDLTHLHAVTAVGSHSFSYDANGNMTGRTVGGQSFTLSYDAENRLVSVSGAATASFVYDGDGVRVKGTAGGVTTYYPNRYYEVAGGVVKKYYYAGDQRVAMRNGGALYWLLGDHLGSTAYTVSGTSETGEVRYKAFGATRFTSGTTPTTYRYTGQREEAGLGLYYYGARWYDPVLGHFLQPDTIIPEPGNMLDYHRYGYTRFNPLKYNDPTSHTCSDSAMQVTPTDDRAFRCVDTRYLRARMAGAAVAGSALNVILPDGPAAFSEINPPREQESYPLLSSKAISQNKVSTR